MKTCFTIWCVLLTTICFAQTADNIPVKRMLIPSMPTSLRNAISNPETGLCIYNTSTDAFNYYNGREWIVIKGVVGEQIDSALAAGAHLLESDVKAVQYPGIEESTSQQKYSGVQSSEGNTGIGAFTSGFGSTAKGDNAVAMGNRSRAEGSESLAIGLEAKALGSPSISLGNGTLATGERAVAMGTLSEAHGKTSFALGCKTIAIGNNATAIGNSTVARADRSTAMGYASVASGLTSTAMGNATLAKGYTSIAMGDSSEAIGDVSSAIGDSTVATGYAAMARGVETVASGYASTAMGDGSIASGHAAVARGVETRALGFSSLAAGERTVASGYAASARGVKTNAAGYASMSIGHGTMAPSYTEVSIGSYPTTYIPMGGTDGFANRDRVLSVGIGTDTLNRKDAFVVLKNGNVGIGVDHFEKAPQTSKLQVNGPVSIIDGTQGIGRVLTSDSLGKASWQPLHVKSGSYVPKVLAKSNVDGAQMHTAHYTRNDQMVTVIGTFEANTLQPETLSSITLDLPVETHMMGRNEASGIASCPQVAGMVASAWSDMGSKVSFEWKTPATGKNTWSYRFDYVIK